MSAIPIPITPGPSVALAAAQQLVAAALASGSSISAAAASARVHRSTVHHWLKTNPAFAAAVDQARAEYALEFADRLQDLAKLALNTIEGILKDPAAPPAVRLKAALSVLDRQVFGDGKLQHLPAPHSVPPPQPAQHRSTLFDTPSQPVEAVAPGVQTKPVIPQTPRNAPCPCGSGQKFKRCCGRGAPALLSCKSPES